MSGGARAVREWRARATVGWPIAAPRVGMDATSSRPGQRLRVTLRDKKAAG
jgi:hypothetical protein